VLCSSFNRTDQSISSSSFVLSIVYELVDLLKQKGMHSLFFVFATSLFIFTAVPLMFIPPLLLFPKNQ
ncbi:unnamed protein product, partial [Brassica rapa subsp. trilocularis]